MERKLYSLTGLVVALVCMLVVHLDAQDLKGKYGTFALTKCKH